MSFHYKTQIIKFETREAAVEIQGWEKVSMLKTSQTGIE